MRSIYYLTTMLITLLNHKPSSTNHTTHSLKMCPGKSERVPPLLSNFLPPSVSHSPLSASRLSRKSGIFFSTPRCPAYDTRSPLRIGYGFHRLSFSLLMSLLLQNTSRVLRKETVPETTSPLTSFQRQRVFCLQRASGCPAPDRRYARRSLSRRGDPRVSSARSSELRFSLLVL